MTDRVQAVIKQRIAVCRYGLRTDSLTNTDKSRHSLSICPIDRQHSLTILGKQILLLSLVLHMLRCTVTPYWCCLVDLCVVPHPFPPPLIHPSYRIVPDRRMAVATLLPLGSRLSGPPMPSLIQDPRIVTGIHVLHSCQPSTSLDRHRSATGRSIPTTVPSVGCSTRRIVSTRHESMDPSGGVP